MRFNNCVILNRTSNSLTKNVLITVLPFIRFTFFRLFFQMCRRSCSTSSCSGFTVVINDNYVCILSRHLRTIDSNIRPFIRSSSHTADVYLTLCAILFVITIRRKQQSACQDEGAMSLRLQKGHLLVVINTITFLSGPLPNTAMIGYCGRTQWELVFPSA